MADEQQPIIIRRKKKGHGGHHGGAWKVAFADFMTAMMAFFLTMWLVGQKSEVREAVAGYFRDPGKFQEDGRSGVLQGSSSPVKNSGQPLSIMKKTEETGGGKGPTAEERHQMSLMAKTILENLEKQAEFKRLRDNVKIQLTSEGLRIILNESEESPAFFEPGSAKLLQKSAVILITIARQLGQITNRLVIEGHTDASYTGSGGYGNWELSADRANAARQLMGVSGLYEGQVREVRGFADQYPMIKENPSDPKNRRVSLLLLYKSREQYYDQLELGQEIMEEITG
ncbi:MAG: flagellar motor protein MotB [bacterium]|nr:flagellar motor protein MotB [bacterium]